MSDSDSQASLTDKEKLQDAEDTIHELQHELEKLQMELVEDSNKQGGDGKSQIESLQHELKNVKKEHEAEIKVLQEQMQTLVDQHNIALELLQENYRLQVEQHQETVQELGNLVKFQQQEQLNTLNDFTAKLTEVAEMHQEAIQTMELKHAQELANQKKELLAATKMNTIAEGEE